MGVAWTRANQLIKGKRGVTTNTELRLEQLFGMSAEFWLTHEAEGCSNSDVALGIDRRRRLNDGVEQRLNFVLCILQRRRR